MKKLYCFLPLLLSMCLMLHAKTEKDLNTAAKVQQMNRHTPLLFAENKGQINDINGNARPDILFKCQQNNTTVYLSKNGISYQFTNIIYPKGYNDAIKSKDIAQQARLGSKIETQTFLFSVALQDANPDPVIRKEGKSNFVENFYTGNALHNGILNVGNYEKIVYENIYPGIDWVVYSKNEHLKYDFIIHPGADPSQIKLKIKDADKVSITKAGALLMQTRLGEVNEKAPVSFADGVAIPSSFKQNEDGSIGFDVIAAKDKTIIIDPFVVWATYYGGVQNDYMVSAGICQTDASGNVFLGGWVSSTGVAASGFQNTFGGGNNGDAFLIKFDASGNRLWATYYGGSGNELGQTAAIDAAGNVYLAGGTKSLGMAAGGYQNTYGGSTANGIIGDAFLVKFNSAGARLWATYYGGSSDDVGNSCAVDASGNIYLAGQTNSSSGISSANGFQTGYNGGAGPSTTDGSGDAFLVKFDSLGNRIWATYYGGTSGENCYGCAVDASGNVFITGGTSSSSNIASSNAYQPTFPGLLTTTYLAKFDANGNRLWGTYYGSGGGEGRSCATDASGNIYMAGSVSNLSGNSNMSSGGFQNTIGGFEDAFLAKFNASGTRLWCTYYGGTNDELGSGTFVDNAGNVYLTGQTQSSGNIASGGIQNTIAGANDGFLVKFNTSGTRIWGTYYGSSGDDIFCHGTVDALGNIYVGGYTNSTSGVAQAGFQNALGGNYDLLLVKIRETCLPSTVTVTKTTCSNQLPYIWNGISVPAGGNAVAKDTFINTSGCDSIVTLNLVVNTTPPLTNVYDTACVNSLPFIWNNISVTGTAGNSSIANYTAQAANGCDSLVKLHLFVRNPTTNTVTQTICSNQLPYLWNNISVTAGGNAAAVFNGQNSLGCDSVVTLHLIVNNTSAHTDSVSICSNQLPYVWHGITVTAGGPAAATFTTTNAAGCDSVVTLNLNVRNTSSSTVNQTICAGQLPYTWNGIVVTAAGNNVATYTTPNAVSCDSVVTLNLIITPSIAATIGITASPSNNVPLGTAVTYTASVTNGGTNPVLQWRKNGINVGGNSASYLDLSVDSGDVITCTVLSNAPCVFPDTAESNVIVMTVVSPPPACLVPVSLISTDIQLSTAVFKWANVAGATGYEITLDMIPGNPSSGMFTTDTVYHASAMLPGVHYFHIRTRCANGIYSDWITITITIQDSNPTGTSNVNGNGSGVEMYPNPNNGVFNVQGIVIGKNATIDIVDKAGRIIYSSEAQVQNGILNHHVDLSGALSSGVYLLRVTSGYNVYVLKFVHD